MLLEDIQRDRQKLLDFAEICGIHAGDGWLSTSINEVGFGTSMMEEQYFYYVFNLYQETFGFLGYRILQRPENGILEFRIQSKQLQEAFMQTGFPKGPKIDRLAVPEFILGEDEFMKAFLRGIFDTDGNVYWRKSGSQYRIIISVSTSCQSFAKEIKSMLQLLDIYAKINVVKGRRTKQGNLRKDSHKVVICRLRDVRRYITEIGFSNKKKSMANQQEKRRL